MADKEPQSVAIFDIDKQETRDALMAAIATKAPEKPCMAIEPVINQTFPQWSVVLEGYADMSPDDAEWLCFALYAQAQIARKHNGG